jgi:DeoR family transcriptional regulator of aga operon
MGAVQARGPRRRASAGERRRTLAELVTGGGTWQVHDLAARLGVSEATVRRDLAALERSLPAVQRGWGSVTYQNSPVEIAFAAKLNVHRAAKESIAPAVAGRLRDGQVVFLNGGTTTTLVARAIARRGVAVTVVTNAVNIAYELLGSASVSVVLLGGTVHRQNYELIGSLALDGLSRLSANIAVLGCDGVSVGMGASTVVVPEADVARAMAERAEEVWIVADRSKLGRNSLVSIVPLERIGVLFVDSVPDELRRVLADRCEVVVCGR